ncbi:helix-turn-helix transcriptional regulator [Olsenella sp. DSM 107455]|uniref:Helix-turn-helix transcriptional regulator n=1 Tax=Thermophilibacter gallinarum TaxID=2779357 RepID=A0ABR9QSE3_9ACTN|nr:helix-turn-helix domain-containing protein [Thermophilibacter gallinarum]MBE5023986.1 helix-turn-helix transcriptional regulator [Thermophilibacter gallinarum]
MPISAPRQAGIYVRRAREAQGLTRAQLAAAAGVSERLLASLELGDATGIRLDKLLAVFDALGLSLAAQGEKIASPVSVAASAPIPQRSLVAPVSTRRNREFGLLDYGAALRDFIVNDMGISLPEEAI